MGLKHVRYMNYLHHAAIRYSEVFEYQSNPRIGQSYYNTFRLLYPDLEDEIVNTEFDCFNENSKLPSFLTWVQARLDRLDDTK